jgi:hypothetical protein
MQVSWPTRAKSLVVSSSVRCTCFVEITIRNLQLRLSLHNRSPRAVFRVMLVVRPVVSDSTDQLSPLQQMTDEERLIADFHGPA